MDVMTDVSWMYGEQMDGMVDVMRMYGLMERAPPKQ